VTQHGLDDARRTAKHEQHRRRRVPQVVQPNGLRQLGGYQQLFKGAGERFRASACCFSASCRPGSPIRFACSLVRVVREAVGLFAKPFDPLRVAITRSRSGSSRCDLVPTTRGLGLNCYVAKNAAGGRVGREFGQYPQPTVASLSHGSNRIRNVDTSNISSLVRMFDHVEDV
jgi:hypothetical protein